MKFEKLRQAVCRANIELEARHLVTYTWGNVSGIDRDAGVVAIKPSGVAYSELTGDNIVLLNFDGEVLEGDLKPSSDTPTHLELYRNFAGIGGICHTHSPMATIWAQAEKELPCLGTTHADYFYGTIPVTDRPDEQEIKSEYELNTGRVIVRRFADIDPAEMSAVLVAGHGPFTWGPGPEKALENAVVLEQIAGMALGTLLLNPEQKGISKQLLDKHYLRKHGKDAYYGQK